MPEVPRNSYVEAFVNGQSESLFVARFSGFEELSQLYRIEVVILSDKRDRADTIIGADLTLSIHDWDKYENDHGRDIHGIAASVEQREQAEGLTEYRVVLVPKIWRATLNRDFELYKDMSVVDMVKRIAGMHGCMVETRCSTDHPVRHETVQYAESDWDFIARLMEEEGIYFYFDNSGSASSHTLVIADSGSFDGSTYPDELQYQPDGYGLVGAHSIADFAACKVPVVHDAMVVDHELCDRNADIVGQGNRTVGVTFPKSAGDSAHFRDYQVANSTSFSKASLVGKVQMQRLEHEALTATGRSDAPGMLVAHKFKLTHHPFPELCQRYVVRRIEHTGRQVITGQDSVQASGYENRIWCFPDGRPYRPPLRTPRPRIYGQQTAIVTRSSTKDEDKCGTVSVKFPWPRRGRPGELELTRVPVSQAWAGAGYGAMFLPRIGHDVLVEFIGGDPDRPVVTGRVYSATSPTPYKLPAERTKSTIKTRSSSGDLDQQQGFNELMFEDAAGKEEIYLHGQRDLRIEILNDKSQEIGHDETLDVGNDRTKTIGGNQSEKVTGNQTIEVGGNHDEKIKGTRLLQIDKSNTVMIQGADSETVMGGRVSTIQKSLVQTVGGPAQVMIQGKMDHTVLGEVNEVVAGKRSTTVVGAQQLVINDQASSMVAKDSNEHVGGNKTEMVGKDYALLVGSGSVTVKQNGDIVISGKQITIKGTGPIQVEGQKLEVKSNGTVSVTASGAVKVKGSAVNVN